MPQGDFEESHTHFWSVVPSIQNQLGGRVNWSFERYVGKHERPTGWEFEADGPGVFGVYDWKVMHNDADSGRSWHGRSSMMIGVKPGEAKKGSTGRWVGRFSLERVRRTKLRVTVHAHGENLEGVQTAGMRMALLDETGRPLSTSDALVPGESTFPWTPLSVEATLVEKAAELQIECFLTAQPDATAGGRIWFDGLLIEDATIRERPEVTVRSAEDAAHGARMARWTARSGWDLISVPFRIPKREKPVLKASFRSKTPQTVELSVVGPGEAATTVTVGKDWQTVTLPLAPADGKRDSRVLVRPLTSGILDVDKLRIE